MVHGRDRDDKEEIRAKERTGEHDMVVDCLYCCLFAPHAFAFLSKFVNELEGQGHIRERRHCVAVYTTGHLDYKV